MTTKTIVQRRLEKIIDKNGEPTHRFMRFLEELNGNSNEMINSLTGFNEFDDLITESAKDQLLLDVVSTAVNYTTVGDQVIKCTSALTVTLNDEPEDQEKAKILVTNGDVKIDGNGRNIDGATDVTIVFANIQPPATVDCLYLVETDEWIIE